MGAGESQVAAQEVDEQDARLHVARALGAVDGQGDSHRLPSFALATAVFSPRWTKTRTTSFLYAALPRTSSLGAAALALADRDADLRHDLVWLDRRLKWTLEKVRGVDHSRARRGLRDDVGVHGEDDRAPVAGRVGVADRAGQRAAVADQRIGDP